MIVPKPLEKVFYFYPTLLVAEGVSLLALATTSTIPLSAAVPALLFVLYFQSPLIWRALRAKYGLPVGRMVFGKREKDGSLWFILLQLQAFYIAFHSLERLLMLLPGAYSAWLRLWGSKIGMRVMWTPETMLYDRTHLEIGDYVLFGGRVVLSSHLIRKEEGKYFLQVGKTKIGSGTLVGSETTIGPGVTIPALSMTDFRSAYSGKRIVRGWVDVTTREESGLAGREDSSTVPSTEPVKNIVSRA